MVANLTQTGQLLDVAANIVANGGFATLTIEGLAEQAGMSSEQLRSEFGGIEPILVLMLNREFTGIYVDIVDHIERDPRGGRLSRIYYYTLAAVYERPLARMLYTIDPKAMNAIMRTANSFGYLPAVSVRATLIESMQTAGMVRREVDASTVSSMLTVFSAGLALTSPHEDIDRVVRGMTDLLGQVVDEEVEDTMPGKRAFYDWALSLAGKN